MKYLVGFIIGAGFTYLVGVLVAWSFNPGDWSAFWRLNCLVFALIWGVVGGAVANDFRLKRKVKPISGGIINEKQ